MASAAKTLRFCPRRAVPAVAHIRPRPPWLRASQRPKTHPCRMLIPAISRSIATDDDPPNTNNDGGTPPATAEDVNSSPDVGSTTPAPALQSMTASPVAETTTPLPAVESTITSPVIESPQDAPIIGDMQHADAAPVASATEKSPAPLVKNVKLADISWWRSKIDPRILRELDSTRDEKPEEMPNSTPEPGEFAAIFSDLSEEEKDRLTDGLFESNYPPPDKFIVRQQEEVRQQMREDDPEATSPQLPSWVDTPMRRRMMWEALRDVTREAGRPTPNRGNEWDEDEPDQFAQSYWEKEDEDEFDEDDILSMAHAKLEEHREYRQYMRLAAWELPLLHKLAKPYERPQAEKMLRFRHTTYMGEYHPAEKKVVVEFCPEDLPLTPEQVLKLKKLAGIRYNPERNVVKMSCEAYGQPAQNKRRLGDLVNKLVEEAKNPADDFKDVPLDLRHHPIRKKPAFPRDWRLTPERSAHLELQRQEIRQLEEQQHHLGMFVNGDKIVKQAVARGIRQATLLATGSSRRATMPPATNTVGGAQMILGGDSGSGGIGAGKHREAVPAPGADGQQKQHDDQGQQPEMEKVPVTQFSLGDAGTGPPPSGLGPRFMRNDFGRRS